MTRTRPRPDPTTHNLSPSQGRNAGRGGGDGHEGFELAPDPSGPNNVPGTGHPPPPTVHDHPRRTGRASTGEPAQGARRQLIDVPPLSNPHRTLACAGATWTPGTPPTSKAGGRWVPVLLRKEVIQPHLPVRLPCYDLVPIASPTFDGSSSCELGHRLRVLPTFVT